MARRVLWYALAYTIVIIVHEAAHAATARAFGLEPTLYHFWVDFDGDKATAWQRAAIGLAGPVSSLAVGVAAWVACCGSAPGSLGAMPLLFLAACGVSNFFGNMMSAAFVGDFSNAANWLGLPMAVRYALSAAGAVVTASVLFVAGRALARSSSGDSNRSSRIALETVVLPVIIGTAIIIVINQPTPIPGFAAARAGEAAFWVFGIAGIFTAPPSAAVNSRQRLVWSDGALAVLVLAVVRIMALGIPLG